MIITAIELLMEKIAKFCHKWQVTELALFGSVLRDDFRPDSDISPSDLCNEIFNLVGVDSPPLCGEEDKLQSEALGWQQILFHTPSACSGVH